jgi:AcrR family transcriptional regulator
VTARADRVDRAALVRRALVQLVAAHGFHGVSMAAVAKRAGVATGTTYVHYASKDALVHAAHREVKQALGEAAIAGVDPAAPPRERFVAMWRNTLAHLLDDPVRAAFLVQFDVSPYATDGLEVSADENDPLRTAAAAPDMVEALVDLPPDVLYDLGLGPVVRLAARWDDRSALDRAALDRMAEACWRAISRP